MHWNS